MSLIYSYLNYCNLIWGAVDVTIIDPLFKLQKKAIRIINKSHYLEHTNPIFKSLNVLTVHQVYDLNCLLFAFKCINCNFFPTFKDKISQGQSVHEHNTRNKENYKTDAIARLKICQQSFIFHGVNLWNTIDVSLRAMHSVSDFKQGVNEY